MKIEEYSQQALTTLSSSHGITDLDASLISQVYGLVEEGGEVAGKFKKLIRDKNGELSDEDRKEILKELGDVLWYVNSISTLLGSSLEDVAATNLETLASRKDRGTLSGSGDNR